MLDEKIYNYIVTYIQKHGYAPSYREIADEVDVASTSTVHAYLQELFECGLLEKDCEKNVPRAIRVSGYEFVRKEKGKRNQGSLRCWRKNRMGIQVSDARKKLDLLEQLKESPELLFTDFVINSEDVQLLNLIEIDNISARRYIQGLIGNMEVFRDTHVLLKSDGKLCVYVSALRFGIRQKFQEDDQIAEINLFKKSFHFCEEYIAGYQKALSCNDVSETPETEFSENTKYTFSRRLKTSFSKLKSNNSIAIRIFDFLYYLLISRKKMEKQLMTTLKAEKKRAEFEKKFRKERMELKKYYQVNFPQHLEEIRRKQQILDMYLSDLGYECV